MGQSQDSTNQSQELTKEQRDRLKEHRGILHDSLLQIENPQDAARERSKILSMIVDGDTNGLSNEQVFMQMVAKYPYSMHHEVTLEGIEDEVAYEYSSEHMVSHSISVENTYVDIDVEIDLSKEIREQHLSITSSVELDGCDIIESYMEQAGTRNPVFFLAKVAEILFEKSNHEADMRTELAEAKLRNVTGERDAVLASNKELIAQLAKANEVERDLNAIIAKLQKPQDDLLRESDLQCKELTIAFNKMQDRVFALTDIMKDILTDEPISISDVLNDAIRNYGLESTK